MSRAFLFMVMLMIQQAGICQSRFIAHSHNDYEQTEPLTKALALGFTSIEIDITTHRGQLKVSHNQRGLDKKPSMETLYLEKLYEYVEVNKKARLWLLVDLKKGGTEVLELLHELVSAKGSLFQSRNSAEKRPLQIILSGSVDRKYVAENPKYVYFYLDGRVKHLEEVWDSQLMPLISSNFNSVVSWDGKGVISAEDKAKIESLVNKAKQQGKKLRFWKTPDTPHVWDILLDLNLPLIGVDHLEKFYQYLEKIKISK